MRTIVPCIRTLVLSTLLTVSSLCTFSQSITTGNGKIEIGAGVGPLFFLGDLGGNYGKGSAFLKDVNLAQTKMVKGLYANIYPTEWFGFRVALNHGRLEAYDSVIQDKGGAEIHRKNRNLQFQSPLLEAYVAAEIYPTVLFEKHDGLQGKIRPYGLIGVGVFKFNPQGRYYDPNGNSAWVDLQPLRLEGQGMAEYKNRNEYKLMSLEIPMGVGIKYYVRDNFYIGMEVLHRKTFTDYIDDVSTTYIDANLFDTYLSPEQAQMARQLYFRENFVPNAPLSRFPTINEQRGDSKEKDSFFSSIIRIGWRLNDSNSPGGRAARQLRCPNFY